MSVNVKECTEKFHEILKHLKPHSQCSDDTFIEKIQTYLKSDGKSKQNIKFHNFDLQFH